MRSPREITFRVRQEATNAYLLLRNPFLRQVPEFQCHLPEGHGAALALDKTAFCEQVSMHASQIHRGRLPIFDQWMETGANVDWRRDYAHGVSSGTPYFRKLPYLNFQSVGDHKYVWEINRHQHLVVLAQAYLFDRSEKHLVEIARHLEAWTRQNPFQKGINWASALEVAFRGLSWIWVLHLVGPFLAQSARTMLVQGLYQHGLHLAANLSVYFSPNTHLLGEAVALHAIATFLPALPESSAWRKTAASIVTEQLAFQVKPDGSHFEQSSYYHVYALDFFLFHYLVGGRPKHFEPVLLRMGDYLFWLLGSNRRIFLVGDDDGGRLFHPYGKRRQFGRATLSTCGILFGRDEWLGDEDDVAEQAVWWLGPDALNDAKLRPSRPAGSRFFSDSGTLVLQSEEFQAQMDCGPFGYGGAGHSHSDTLSVCLSGLGEDIFIDPGTATYVSDPFRREWFRSTGAHNTVETEGRNQGISAGPFRWSEKPEVQMNRWRAGTEGGGSVSATCSYSGLRHTRQLLVGKDFVAVSDQVAGDANGEHRSIQHWNLASDGSAVDLQSSKPIERRHGPRSPVYGTVQEGPVAAASCSGRFPHTFMTVLRMPSSRISMAEAARGLLYASVD